MRQNHPLMIATFWKRGFQDDQGCKIRRSTVWYKDAPSGSGKAGATNKPSTPNVVRNPMKVWKSASSKVMVPEQYRARRRAVAHCDALLLSMPFFFIPYAKHPQIITKAHIQDQHVTAIQVHQLGTRAAHWDSVLILHGALWGLPRPFEQSQCCTAQGVAYVGTAQFPTKKPGQCDKVGQAEARKHLPNLGKGNTLPTNFTITTKLASTTTLSERHANLWNMLCSPEGRHPVPNHRTSEQGRWWKQSTMSIAAIQPHCAANMFLTSSLNSATMSKKALAEGKSDQWSRGIWSKATSMALDTAEWTPVAGALCLLITSATWHQDPSTWEETQGFL